MKVEVQGGEIHTVSLGSTNEALLIIHGGPDWDHTYLLKAAEKIAEHRRVILFDIRGCGESTKFKYSSAYNFNNVVSDIRKIIDKYGLDACDILGFSFGGSVATHLLRKHPEAVNKLILASTTVFRDYQSELDAIPEFKKRRTPELDEFIKYAFKEAVPIGEEPGRSMAIKTLPLDVHDLSHLNEMESVIEKITFSGEWLKALREGGFGSERIDVASLIKETGKDVLIIHGEHDLRFPVSVAHKLYRSVPGAKLSVISGAGHLAHLEKPEQWVAEVVSFLGNYADGNSINA